MSKIDDDIIYIAKQFKAIKGSEQIIENIIKAKEDKVINTIYISHWRKIKFYLDNL